MQLVGCFQSALEANAVLLEEPVDLVFLDINLPDISGIQYFKTLIDPPAVIMTTAYQEHAVESFELDTICDYLVKPFSFERFLKAINKTKRKTVLGSASQGREKEAVESIFLNIDKTHHKIGIDDILYIESNKNYVTITTKTGRFSYLDSLKNWAAKLSGKCFVQVHRSYIVNYLEIDKITGNQIFLKGQKIPVGRVYKSSLLKKLGLGQKI